MTTSATGQDQPSLAALYLSGWQPDQPLSSLASFLGARAGVTSQDRLAVVLEDQSRRWEEGYLFQPEAYFELLPDLYANSGLQLEVVYNDFDLRRSGMGPVDPNEYYARFPQIREELRRQFRVSEALKDASVTVSWPPPPDAPDDPADSADAPGEDPEAPLRLADFDLKEPIDPTRAGTVCRAWRKSTRSYVALKFFGEHHGSLAALRREMFAASRLRHAGIVAVHGAGRTPSGGYFLVLSLIDGPSLAERMKMAPLAPRQSATIVAEVADAIDHAHRQGVVHCDLKPANILIDRDGRALVTDFGLARRLVGDEPDLPHPDDISGTAPYMAPEQFERSWGPVDLRTDVYGLGAILFDLLAGRPPFLGPTLITVYAQVAAPQPAPSPRSFRRDVPRGLEAICARCLQKDPTLRLGSAAEVARDLRTWLDIRRRRRRAGLLAVGMLLIGSVLGWKFATRPPTPPIELTTEVIRHRGSGDYRQLLLHPESLAPGDGLAVHSRLSREAFITHFRISTSGAVDSPDPEATKGSALQWASPPKPRFEPIQGPPGTMALILVASDTPLDTAQTAQIQETLKAIGKLQPLEKYAVLVDGMPAGEHMKGHAEPAYLIEPQVNQVLEHLRKKLEAEDRTIKIVALRQEEAQ